MSMTATLLDGRLVSDSVLTEVKREVRKIKSHGVTSKLVIILAGDDPASVSYIRQKTLAAEKVGIESEMIRLSDKTTTKQLLTLIEKLNGDAKVHGILVQLPLPANIETPLVIRAVDPMKDVDGFHAYNLGKLFLSKEFEWLAPCTPRGIVRLLEYYKIPVAGRHVVIVGRSNVVGKPLAIMLINRDATVTVCHSRTEDLASHTRQADILVAAVGKPQIITTDMVKAGAVVIDVGVTKVENKLTGDVDFQAVKEIASYLTPVPGGVGPMTVACLMENVVRSTKRLHNFDF